MSTQKERDEKRQLSWLLAHGHKQTARNLIAGAKHRQRLAERERTRPWRPSDGSLAERERRQ